MVPGLLFLVALGTAAVPWLARRAGRLPLLVAFLLGAALSAVGAVLALPWYPWTDLLVLLVALSAGVLAGRAAPKEPFRLFLVLVILSLLDIVQFVLTSGPASPGVSAPTGPSPLDYLNLSIPPPIGRFNLGIFDLLILAMLSESWRVRGGSLPIALVPALAGFALAEVVVLASPLRSLPLIPFLAAGWLVSEATWWYLQRSRRPTVSG